MRLLLKAESLIKGFRFFIASRRPPCSPTARNPPWAVTMKTELIYSLTEHFEGHAQQTNSGVEFWLARDLQCTASFAYACSAPNKSDLDNHQTYRNHDGETVHFPAHSRSGKAPDGATARCRDGTWSFSRHRSGTCSRHGGVAAWRREHAASMSKQINARRTAIFIEVQCRHFPRAAGNALPRTESRGFPAET